MVTATKPTGNPRRIDHDPQVVAAWTAIKTLETAAQDLIDQARELNDAPEASNLDDKHYGRAIEAAMKGDPVPDELTRHDRIVGLLREAEWKKKAAARKRAEATERLRQLSLQRLEETARARHDLAVDVFKAFSSFVEAVRRQAAFRRELQEACIDVGLCEWPAAAPIERLEVDLANLREHIDNHRPAGVKPLAV